MSSIAAGTTTGSALVSTGDTTGELVLKINGTTTAVTIDTSGNLQFNSGYGSVATAYGCRAWVNFNGTGTVAIREDGNVTNITDNGTGNYTINFTTAMPDANYSAVFCGGDTAIAANSPIGYLTTTTTSAQTIRTYNLAGSLFDAPVINVAIFR